MKIVCGFKITQPNVGQLEESQISHLLFFASVKHQGRPPLSILMHVAYNFPLYWNGMSHASFPIVLQAEIIVDSITQRGNELEKLF